MGAAEGVLAQDGSGVLAKGLSGGSLPLIRPHCRPGPWHPGAGRPTELGGRQDVASWERRSPRRPRPPQAASGRLATGRLTCLAEVGFDTVHRLKCLFLCFSFH